MFSNGLFRPQLAVSVQWWLPSPTSGTCSSYSMAMRWWTAPQRRAPSSPSTRVSTSHKVLTYLEYRAVPGVFKNIDPSPPLHPASVCVLPPHQRRGYTLAGRWGGWGVNILEDASHRIGLLQSNLSTALPVQPDTFVLQWACKYLCKQLEKTLVEKR